MRSNLDANSSRTTRSTSGIWIYSSDSWHEHDPVSGCVLSAVTLNHGFLDQAAEFFYWLCVVVNLKPQHHVIVEPDAAVFFDDQHRGRLHAPLVASRGLARFERSQEAER